MNIIDHSNATLSGLHVPLNKDFLASLRGIRRDRIDLRAGQEFMSEGDSNSFLFLVDRGLGLRAKYFEDGRRQIFNILFPNDIVGLQAMMIGQTHHHAVAQTDMTLSLIEYAKIRELWRDELDAVVQTLKALAFDEVQIMRVLLVTRRLTAVEALASMLLSIYRRGEHHGLVRDGAMSFPFRQQDLADMLGLSVVHTNKSLARLREAGLVELYERRLAIPDVQALIDVHALDRNMN